MDTTILHVCKDGDAASIFLHTNYICFTSSHAGGFFFSFFRLLWSSVTNCIRLLFQETFCVWNQTKKTRLHDVKFNIISSWPLLSLFQKLTVVTTVSTNTPQQPSSAFTGKAKGFFFFFRIIDNSFFKCGSLGRALLMYCKLITIFALMMHKVLLSVEKWKPSYTTHPNFRLCSFH